jgi:hypothetical protein
MKYRYASGQSCRNSYLYSTCHTCHHGNKKVYQCLQLMYHCFLVVLPDRMMSAWNAIYRFIMDYEAANNGLQGHRVYPCLFLPQAILVSDFSSGHCWLPTLKCFMISCSLSRKALGWLLTWRAPLPTMLLFCIMLFDALTQPGMWGT